MDIRGFAIAVLPAFCAEVALNMAHSAIAGEGDLSWFDWSIVLGSSIVFPMWAGGRVARAGGMRRWSSLGGVCVMLGTLLAIVMSELFQSSPDDVPWNVVSFGLLLCIPVFAILGFLGGALAKRRIQHGA